MPVFHYRCRKCGKEIEEIQNAPEPLPEQQCEEEQCDFELLPWFAKKKSASLRFRASEGVGGWERQGDLLVRKVKGKHSTRYGEGV